MLANANEGRLVVAPPTPSTRRCKCRPLPRPASSSSLSRHRLNQRKQGWYQSCLHSVALPSSIARLLIADTRTKASRIELKRSEKNDLEEVFVVEAQPGSVSAVASLESLDVLDKVPDSVATPLVFTMER